MNHTKGTTIPYRTDAENLNVLINAVGRDRDMGHIQGLFQVSGTFQGSVSAAQELGFLDPESSKLLLDGNDYLLASDSQKAELLLKAIMQYEPYQLLLEAVFSRNAPKETTMEWMSKWWSTQGYGASQNNREEGATTLAKFLEYANMGRFMIGRRGRPTRIEWSSNANKMIHDLILGEDTRSYDSDSTGDEYPEGRLVENSQQLGSQKSTLPFGVGDDNNSEEYSNLSIPLGRGKVAQFRLPTKITNKDKDRLLKIMELLIETDDDPQESPDEV